MYDLLGFQYIKEERLDANGWPISSELKNKGYTQVNSSDGFPKYYVRPNKVLILFEKDGKNVKYDIYKNIMAIYPDRKKMSLRLAQEVVINIMTGKLKIQFRDGGEIFLEKSSKPTWKPWK